MKSLFMNFIMFNDKENYDHVDNDNNNDYIDDKHDHILILLHCSGDRYCYYDYDDY